MMPFAINTSSPAAEPQQLESYFDLAVNGGPMMIPIALCSVIVLAFTIERWLRLRPNTLGSNTFGRQVVAAVQDNGVQSALDLCEGRRWPLARVLAAGLRKAESPFLDREKVVEDVASAEIRALGAKLRPLFIVFLIAPLLGLLGTVGGMIKAFSNIAMQEGIGKPELLAEGIYQALVTTAAGLAVAIPAVIAYYWLRGKVEAFGRRVETLYREVDDALPRAGA